MSNDLRKLLVELCELCMQITYMSNDLRKLLVELYELCMQITYMTLSNDLRKLLVELRELCVEEILKLESRLTQALLSLASE